MDTKHKVRPSKLAQALIQVKGKPLNLADYTPFEQLYDIMPQRMIFMCGRQIGKSVFLGSNTTTLSILHPFFSILFVSPLSQQTSRFSTQYLEPFMSSPVIKKHWIDSSVKKNIFSRTLNNGSNITLGYAESELDADRIRGVSADAMFLDEFQDISIDSEPVLAETLSASEYAYRRYTGTAKGEANSLTVMFKRSNMMEWVVKCGSCGHHAIPHDMETCLAIMNSNPQGPGCPKCGAALDMRAGEWLAARPDVKDFIGAHIPQFCIPARTTPKKWKELLAKVNGEDGKGGYGAVKLANEVFGLPVGAGGRPVSLREVMACCNSEIKTFPSKVPSGILYTTLGVDWSCTGSTESYTVITILGYDMYGKAYVIYVQRLDGIDILEQVKRVISLYRQYNCSMIGSDRGVGVLQGQLLQETLGEDKVCMINYVAAKNALVWNKDANFYSADRTMTLDTTILKVKMGREKLETPCWEIMAPFWQDLLNIFEEETQSGRRVYRREVPLTDDFAHSLNFANIANMIVKGEFVYADSEAVKDDTFKF